MMRSFTALVLAGLANMCSGQTCMELMMGMQTSCSKLVAMAQNQDGDMPSDAAMSELCEPGDCKTILDKLPEACKDDPMAPMAKMLESVGALCHPCLRNFMKVPSVCGMESEDSQPEVGKLCGGACQDINKKLKDDKCEDHQMPNMDMGDRRLSSVGGNLTDFAKVMRRLGAHKGGDMDPDMIKKMMKMMDQSCTDCGKSMMAVMEAKCTTDDVPDASKDGCEAPVCKMYNECPNNPAASPLPMVELAEYNKVKANLAPKCATTTTAADELSASAATSSFGALASSLLTLMLVVVCITV